VLFFCSVLLTRRCNQLIQVVVRVDLSTWGSREQVITGLEGGGDSSSSGRWVFGLGRKAGTALGG
jgi:hypothetical protein